MIPVYICNIFLGGFPMYLHCIRSLLFSEDSWYFFFNIQISYTSVTSYGMFFPIYFHCVRSFHFLKAVSSSFFRFSSSTSVTYTWVVSLCICIVYVRYTFFRDQLFHTQILSTSVTCLWMISLFISIVYICYTFFRKLCWVFLAHPDFGYMCYTLVYSHCRQRTVEIICPHSSTPLQCNEMRPVGNLLSFCALSILYWKWYFVCTH